MCSYLLNRPYITYKDASYSNKDLWILHYLRHYCNINKYYYVFWSGKVKCIIPICRLCIFEHFCLFFSSLHLTQFHPPTPFWYFFLKNETNFESSMTFLYILEQARAFFFAAAYSWELRATRQSTAAPLHTKRQQDSAAEAKIACTACTAACSWLCCLWPSSWS